MSHGRSYAWYNISIGRRQWSYRWSSGKAQCTVSHYHACHRGTRRRLLGRRVSRSFSTKGCLTRRRETYRRCRSAAPWAHIIKSSFPLSYPTNTYAMSIQNHTRRIARTLRRPWWARVSWAYRPPSTTNYRLPSKSPPYAQRRTFKSRFGSRTWGRSHADVGNYSPADTSWRRSGRTFQTRCEAGNPTWTFGVINHGSIRSQSFIKTYLEEGSAETARWREFLPPIFRGRSSPDSGVR